MHLKVISGLLQVVEIAIVMVKVKLYYISAFSVCFLSLFCHINWRSFLFRMARSLARVYEAVDKLLQVSDQRWDSVDLTDLVDFGPWVKYLICYHFCKINGVGYWKTYPKNFKWLFIFSWLRLLNVSNTCKWMIRFSDMKNLFLTNFVMSFVTRKPSLMALSQGGFLQDLLEAWNYVW